MDKQTLLIAYKKAVKEKNATQAIEILKQLDHHLTKAEATELMESASEMFHLKLQTLGGQFSLAVTKKEWKEALIVGQEIVKDFPNSKLASEIRPKLPSIEKRIENKNLTGTTAKNDNFESVLDEVVSSHEDTNASGDRINNISTGSLGNTSNTKLTSRECSSIGAEKSKFRKLIVFPLIAFGFLFGTLFILVKFAPSKVPWEFNKGHDSSEYIQNTIADELLVTGSVFFEDHSESEIAAIPPIKMLSSGKFVSDPIKYKYTHTRIWNINLELSNGVGHNIKFGDNIMLLEVDKNKELIGGSACFTNLPNKGTQELDVSSIPSLISAGHLSSTYGVENWQCCSQDGRKIIECLKGRMKSTTSPRPLVGEELWIDPKCYGGFGGIAHGETTNFQLILKEGECIDTSDRSLVLVLPKLNVIGKSINYNYSIILFLDKSPNKDDAFQVGKKQVVPLSYNDLEALVKDTDMDFTTRLLAINWLAEEYSDQSVELLIEMGDIFENGKLLTSCMLILTKLNCGGLVERASMILNSQEIPFANRYAAMKYLEVTSSWPYDTPIPDGFSFSKLHFIPIETILDGVRILQTTCILEGYSVRNNTRHNVTLVVSHGPGVPINTSLTFLGLAKQLAEGYPITWGSMSKKRMKGEMDKLGASLHLLSKKDDQYFIHTIPNLDKDQASRYIELPSIMLAKGKIKDGVPMVSVTRKKSNHSKDITMVSKSKWVPSPTDNPEPINVITVTGITDSNPECFQDLAEIVDTFCDALSQQKTLKFKEKGAVE